MATTVGACKQVLIRAGVLANTIFISYMLSQRASKVKVKLAPDQKKK